MENVEGVTAEETTAEESVENQTPETQAEDKGETIAEESNESTTQETVEDKATEKDDELQKLISDNPKLKEYIEKQKTEAIDKKESRRKAALKQSNERIQKLQAEIDKYKSAQDTEELDINDFESEDEYQLAKLKKEIKEEANSEKLEEAEQAFNAEQKQMVEVARDKFATQEQEVASQNPDYADNAQVFESYTKMVDQNDPGFQVVANYLAFEADNGAALINHLGKNPDKIEALFGKPPAFIKQKIQAYEKEIQSAPKPPAPKPSLPEPPKPAKGSASPRPQPVDMSKKQFKEWLNS